MIQGSEPLEFKWFKNGIELQTDSIQHQIDTKSIFSMFTLNQITPNDSGNYSCVVSNNFGFDAQWTVLEVKGLIKYPLNLLLLFSFDLKGLPKCGAQCFISVLNFCTLKMF